MVFHRLDRKLNERFPSVARSRRQQPEHSRRRLFLESLEPRELMAGLDTDTHTDPFPNFPGNYYPPVYSQSAGSAAFLSAPTAGDPLSAALSYFQQNASTYGLTSADVSHA